MSSMLTLHRTFGNSAYTPARKDVARICDNKYYLVTLQDSETDQGGGHYLLDSEQTFVMPGHKAPQERESRMNRCNRIQEYAGPVYALLNGSFPFQPAAEPLFTSEAAAAAAYDKAMTAQIAKDANYIKRHRSWLAKSTTEKQADMKAKYPLITNAHMAGEIADKDTWAHEAIAWYDTLCAAAKTPDIKRVK